MGNNWQLAFINGGQKTILTMNIGNKALSFLFASRDKKQFKFVLQNI